MKILYAVEFVFFGYVISLITLLRKGPTLRIPGVEKYSVIKQHTMFLITVCLVLTP